MTEPLVVKQAVDRRFFRMIGSRGSATRRVAVTMIDQCFASASNFAVGVVVAHIAGPAGLGAYPSRTRSGSCSAWPIGRL